MLGARYITCRLTVLGARRRWAHSTAPPLNPVTEQDVEHFAKFLPPTSIFSTLGPNALPPSDLSPYNDDWMGKYHGNSTTVIKPKTTEEVSKIVKHCWERRIGIVPQGGNTGLVGGGVPTSNELILNLGSMSQVRSFDPISGWENFSFENEAEFNIVVRRDIGSRCWVYSPVSDRLYSTSQSHHASRSRC
jgi:hypothetical protein